MSGLVPIAMFIDLYDPKKAASFGPEERFQNADPVNAISFDDGPFGNGDYKYLSFLYSGAAQTKSGDNLEASLVLANIDHLKYPMQIASAFYKTILLIIETQAQLGYQ